MLHFGRESRLILGEQTFLGYTADDRLHSYTGPDTLLYGMKFAAKYCIQRIAPPVRRGASLAGEAHTPHREPAAHILRAVLSAMNALCMLANHRSWRVGVWKHQRWKMLQGSIAI